MIFRKKSIKAISVNSPVVASYTSIPHDKNRSTFSNQIIKLIEESNLCSSSPLVKRLVVKNVKVWCIVVETSGSKSISVICASMPYVLNLIARTSPKLKAMLEDEHCVSFLQETNFETVLASLCSAAIVISKGATKCYQIMSVYFGPEALVFTKNSLFYLKNLFLQSLASAIHFICEDMPHILESFCSQNYAISKCVVENLPVIAMGGAKHFLLLALYIQRWITASLKIAKKCVKNFRQTLLEVCSEVDFVQLVRIMYAYLMSVIAFFASHFKLKIVESALIKCYPILQKYVPLAWVHIWNCIEMCFPIAKTFTVRFLTFLPKILKFIENNKPNAAQVISLAKQYVKGLLCEIKPLSDELFRIIRLSHENIFKLFCFLMPCIEFAVSEIFCNLKCLILSETSRNQFHRAFLRVKELWPMVGKLYFKVCYTLVVFCKYFLKTIREFFSFFPVREITYKCYSLVQGMNSFLQSIVNEFNSTCCDCAKEVLSKSHLAAQTVTPSLWCGWKAATPVTVRASYEICATVKSCSAVLYPELLKAVVIVFPELRNGLVVVLKDSRYACMEVATVSYVASQELLLVAKCVSMQLPFVWRAISKVSVTSSGALTELFLTSSKAGIRLKSDLDLAIQELSLAIHLAQIELLNSVIPASEILILLSEANNVVLTYACKQYLLTVQDFSVMSYNAVRYSCIKMMRVLQWIATYAQNRTASTRVSSIASTLSHFLVDFILHSSDRAIHYSKQMFLAVFYKMTLTIPILWEQSKLANVIIWRQFCRCSVQLWILLEREAGSAFQFTCLYTPDLWDFLKRSSYRIWKLTCDVSPALWDVALPVFPVLWASNCNAIQCVWEFHVKTCCSTWKVIVPMSSSSWKYLLESSPKVWNTFCENSKSQWNSFCNIAEFGWNAMTVSSALSWKIFRKSVSTSWRNVLRPVTTSATSAVAKSLRLSRNVYPKSKDFLLMYKISWYDFSDIKLE